MNFLYHKHFAQTIIIVVSIFTTFLLGLDPELYPFLGNRLSLLITFSILIAIYTSLVLLSQPSKAIQVNKLDAVVIVYFIYFCIRSLTSNDFSLLNPAFQEHVFLIILYSFVKSTFSHLSIPAYLVLNKFFILGVISLGVLQCIFGIFQFFGILHASFPIDTHVFGTFYNSASYSNYLALVFPFALTGSIFFRNGLRNISITAIVLIILLVIPTKGRTAWIAITSSTALFILFYYRQILKKKLELIKTYHKVLISVITIAFIAWTGYELYGFKKNSADGRILIWEISLKSIPDQPILGHGFESYQGTFNRNKSTYFTKYSKSDDRHMLTGSTNTAFNEFIHITVEYGFVGLGLLLTMIFLSFRSATRIKSRYLKYLIILGLISILLMALVSYPFRDINTHVFLFLFLGLTSSQITRSHIRIELPGVTNRLITLTLLLVALFYLYSNFQIIKSSLKWKSGNDLVINDRDSKHLEYYKYAYSYLQWNDEFLYNYASVLLDYDKIDEAINILEKLLSKQYECRVLIRLGNAYEMYGRLERAIECYSNASSLMPYLLTPKYRVFKLHINTNEEKKAYNIAREIASMDIKVNTGKAIEIKAEIIRYLATRNDQNKKP